MYIARILYPVEVLGPGKRVGIWFCGCPHRCRGCSNPELWEFQSRYNVSHETVLSLVKSIVERNQIDGFTITGGDPMYQKDDLKRLVADLHDINSDILVYTGYEFEQVPAEYLENISVLIDGRYIEERNNNTVLRGSDNQKIYILDSALQDKYDEYLRNQTNRIQNFNTTDGIVSVGIHKPYFLEELNERISTKGLNSDE